MNEIREEWWKAAFGPGYSAVYAHRDDTAAAVEIAGLLPRLRAVPGPVLDACCGNGRHVQALRAAGVRALGFDWSMDLLTIAQARPICTGQLTRADMRALPYTPHSCAAVLLLFTAFGYFSDDDNAAALTALGGLLRPEGWLVVDLPEPERLRATLVPESERTAPNGERIRERRRLDGDQVIKDVSVGACHWQERVRLYDQPSFTALAQCCGLRVVDRWRSLHDAQRDDGRLVWWLVSAANPLKNV